MFQLKKRKHCGAMESANHLKNGAGSKSRMSRRNYGILSLLLSLLIFVVGMASTSCGGGDDEEEKYLTASPTNIHFDAEGETSNRDVYISTNISFNSLSIFPSESWCKPVADNLLKKISVNVEKNTTTSLRNAVIVISWHDFYERIYVEQEGIANGGGSDNPDGEGPCEYSEPPYSAPHPIQAVQNGNTIVLSWNDVANATSYNIYKGSMGHYVGTTYRTQYTDNNPNTGSNCYWVKAANCAGESDLYSNMKCCDFSIGGNNEPDKETIPSAPTGVTAKSSGNGIEISWNKVTEATGYKIYRSSSANGSYSFLGSITYNRSYGYDNAPLSGDNYYKITSYNDVGESAKSSYAYYNYSSGGNQGPGGNQGGGTPQKLATPTNLKASSGSSFVQISFNTVSLAYQYELYRATSANGYYSKVSATGGSSGTMYTLTDSNPRSGTSYYKVKAIPLSSLNLTESDLSSYVSVTR